VVQKTNSNVVYVQPLPLNYCRENIFVLA